MTGVPTNPITLPDGRVIGTYVHVAKAISQDRPDEPPVTSNQVYMWSKRSRTNGFPAPVDTAALGVKARGVHFDVAQCVAWRRTYRPRRPQGAPPGNTYALKHGAYAGQEAAKKARGYVRPGRLARQARPGTLTLEAAADIVESAAGAVPALTAAGALTVLAVELRTLSTLLTAAS